MKNQKSMVLNRQQGSTMIEVLVAILVFAIGLLAIVSSQTLGLTNTQSALQRSYAEHLSYELIDLMRLNMQEVRRAGSVFANFDTEVDNYNVEAGCFVVGPGCSAQELGQTSLSEWTEDLQDLLPDSQATLTLDNATGLYTLQIRWLDFRTDEDPSAGDRMLTRDTRFFL